MSSIETKFVGNTVYNAVREEQTGMTYFAYGIGTITDTAILVHITQIGVEFGLSAIDGVRGENGSVGMQRGNRAILATNVFLGVNGKVHIDPNGKQGIERVEHVIAAFKKLIPA